MLNLESTENEFTQTFTLDIEKQSQAINSNLLFVSDGALDFISATIFSPRSFERPTIVTDASAVAKRKAIPAPIR